MPLLYNSGIFIFRTLANVNNVTQLNSCVMVYAFGRCIFASYLLNQTNHENTYTHSQRNPS
ncbi:MAG: hypothetical protein JWO06_987 [Bacteroidota bacterium]|nr:hypothetical protein [Bacteroidota bacterium]